MGLSLRFKLILLNIWNYLDSIFLLRWCRARNFDESQIPVTSGGFILGIPYMQCSYLTHYAIRLKRLGEF